MPFRTAGADAIRQAFIDFFTQRHTHRHVPSSPAVPYDDPTLLFTNAGMNQFKPIFLGTVEPSSPLAGLRRAANSQKCIRAGGKHNDLDDVGRDTYHHTFFEMLGNWSFGDYFKDEAIAWAWEFMTGVIGLPQDRFYATYFGGDDAAGLPADTEARDFWLRYLPANRVLPFGMKANFWEMGDTGPCGPCSELHFDRIGDADRGARPGSGAAAKLVNADDPDVLELWNLVFIQFDRQADGSLRPLPARHVDTGMGFERLVSVVDNRRSNYDTDVFAPLFTAIERITKDADGYHGRLGAADPEGHDTAYRVIADHIRTLTIAITDGAQPSNEGRGYVLRRILRRAVRFGRQRLNAPPGFLSQLVPVVVESLGRAFPELPGSAARVMGIIREEEDSFGRTLDRGIAAFDELAAAGPITGEDAFKLYDTFGFPLDLTEQMALERGIAVDVAGFNAAMDEQKARSRASSRFTAAEGIALSAEAVKHLQDLGIAPTDDEPKHTVTDHAAGSLGRPVRTTIKAIWTTRGFDNHVAAGTATREPTIGIIVARTPFYAEMGGQVADTGRIEIPAGGAEFEVEDVRSYGGYILHIGRVVRGELRIGADVSMLVDIPRRRRIAANHTATHLLNLGLRRHVAHDADQKGSEVSEDKLRFDFNHNGPVDPARLAEVESLVRTLIHDDLQVYTSTAPLTAARAIKGLRAVFGETYPDPVRVVAIGRSVEALLADPADDASASLSIEFCGGTHLHRTSEAADFAIVTEEGISKGVRRITALTGDAARKAHDDAAQLAGRAADAARLPVQHLEAAIKNIEQGIEAATVPSPARNLIRERIHELRERLKLAAKESAAESTRRAAEIANQLCSQINARGDRVSVAIVPLGSDRTALQAAIGALRDQCPACSIMLLSPDDDADRTSIFASVTPEHVAQGLKAGDWVREVAARLGGKGGGKPELAQGSGNTVTGVRSAADHGRHWARDLVAGND